MTRFKFKQLFQNLTKNEKSYLIMMQSWKQEPDIYGIDQFESISLSGRTYLQNIPHGRMRILYRSIHNYSSIEENTFLKERGMLGSYISSVFPLLLFLCPCSPHIIIGVTHRIPLLLLLFPYIIIVM